MTALLPLEGFFQVGYVTTDLERAMAACRANLGIADFMAFDIAQMPNAPPRAAGKVALVWHGTSMIEIIEPAVDHSGIYADALDDTKAFSLHHLAYLISSERFVQLGEDLDAAGIETPTKSINKDVFSLMYADTRALMGHYCEFVAPGPEGFAMLKSIPGLTSAAPYSITKYLNSSE